MSDWSTFLASRLFRLQPDRMSAEPSCRKAERRGTYLQGSDYTGRGSRAFCDGVCGLPFKISCDYTAEGTAAGGDGIGLLERPEDF